MVSLKLIALIESQVIKEYLEKMDGVPTNKEVARLPLKRWSERPWVLEVLTLLFAVPGAILVVPLTIETSELIRWGLTGSAQHGDSSLFRVLVIAVCTLVLLATAFYLRHLRSTIVSRSSPICLPNETGSVSGGFFSRSCYEALAVLFMITGVLMAFGVVSSLF